MARTASMTTIELATVAGDRDGSSGSRRGARSAEQHGPPRGDARLPRPSSSGHGCPGFTPEVSTAGICGFGCTCAAFRVRRPARGLSTFRTTGDRCRIMGRRAHRSRAMQPAPRIPRVSPRCLQHRRPRARARRENASALSRAPRVAGFRGFAHGCHCEPRRHRRRFGGATRNAGSTGSERHVLRGTLRFRPGRRCSRGGESMTGRCGDTLEWR